MEPSVLLAGLGKASLAGASLLLSSTSHSCTLESLCPIRTHISDMGARSFTRNLVRAITFALVASLGITSARRAFMSISLVGLLAKWLSLVVVTLLAALVRGVVRRKNAALVLPPLAGDPGSMIRPGLSWARREAMLRLLSTMKQSSVFVAEMNFPYFL